MSSILAMNRLRRCFFFFQAEDGIRDGHVTGVQTCALPILVRRDCALAVDPLRARAGGAPGPDLGRSPACGARASRQTQGSRVSALRRYDGTLYEGL